MQLLPYLTRIAVADQLARRDALLSILRELDAPFTLSRAVWNDYRPENIVVRFHPQATERFVLGAHYDSVPHSTGANDNGAGVCVLLGLLHMYLPQPPAIPLDIVFFDLEEVGAVGSQAYLNQVHADYIRGMVNLDVCGTGDTILVGPRIHASDGPLSQPVHIVTQNDAFHSRVVDYLPPGDDSTFEHAGIPNLSVCIVPHADVPVLIEAVGAMRQRQRPPRLPRIVETFHNGSRDSLAVIEEAAMQRVLAWVAAVVEHLT
jgi:hypothetical protein